MRIRLLACSLLVALAACGRGDRGTAGVDGGTLVISTAGDAQGFLPPLTDNVTSAQVESQLFDKLAEPALNLNTIGDQGFQPRLAKSWSWAKDSLSITFALDPRARWHDGKPVTARDVRFTWQVYSDPAVGSVVAPLITAIDSVTVIDSLTAVYWFGHRGPEQFFDATFQMRILPEHVLGAIPRAQIATDDFRRHPVGSGPFRFVRWDDRQTIVLEANREYFRGRPHLDRVIFSIAPDPQATVLRLFSGEADFVETMRAADLAELAAHPSVKGEFFPSLAYGYVLFNERDPKHPTTPHPIFGDRAVRRALSMALDRERIVKSVFDTLARTGSGPVPRAYAMYDSTIPLLPFSLDSAARLLDAAGWRVAGADGMRARNGKPLAFSLIVPSSSSPRRQMAELMQEAWRRIGVKLDVEQADFPTFIKRMRSFEFDAAIQVTGPDPSPSSIRQSWGASSARPGGSNFGGYVSAAFDAYVDSATRQMSFPAARAYYRKAYATIIGDAAAVWLYEPASVAGMHRRIHATGVRADAWWANLAEWSIPSDERSARDRAAPDAPSKP